MKNIYRLFIILCFLVTTGIVRGQMNPATYTLDSVYTSNWTNNNWLLNVKEYCTKNASGQITQEFFEKYNSGTSQFVDYLRFLYGYTDTISVPTTITNQLWYSSIWNTFQHEHYLARNTPDTTYYKTFDLQHHVFDNGVMNVYQYNNNQLPLLSILLSYDTTNQSWINVSKTTNTYTSLNQPLEQILSSWESSGSTWLNVIKYDNVYDSNNLLTASIEYTWNNLTSTWNNAFRTTYYYNMAALPDTLVKESYDSIMHVWDSVQRSTYIYNQYNWLMTVPTKSYLQSTGTWVNSSLTFYSYTSGGVQNSATVDTWDTVHLTYITTSYQKADSATGKLGESYTRYVNPQTFLITGGFRDVYTYGTAGDSLNWVNQQWNDSIADWLNKSQVNYTFDSHNLLTEKVNQNWVATSSSWLNTLKSDYYYTASGGIGEHPSKERPCIYSNPLVTGSMIYCPDFNTGVKYTLRVCSLTGVEVYRTNFVGGEAVSISRPLVPGLYFLIIEENGNVLYKDKVIVAQ